jgi:hypothetical protein
MIEVILSGGQTGADQAGLEVARQTKITTGGWAPNGWLTKDGPNQELLQGKYNLREHKGGYKDRTYENVRVSDGTIRCAVDFYTPGEICTFNAIRKYNKPHFDVYLLNPPSEEEFVIWVLRYQIKILNVAGNTENTKGYKIYSMTFNWLYRALQNLYRRMIR